VGLKNSVHGPVVGPHCCRSLVVMSSFFDEFFIPTIVR